MWNPESTDVESGIHSVESGIQDSLGLPYMVGLRYFPELRGNSYRIVRIA